MKEAKNMNVRAKKENAGHEPKKWSDDPTSAKYESRSANSKTEKNK